MSGCIRKPEFKRTRFFCLGLLCPLLWPWAAQAQTWKWTVEEVDIEKGVEQTSIIADKEGNLHLAYYVPSGFGELRYAFRSAADLRWFKMPVDQHLGAFSTGIALDSKDNPGICYTPRQMKYAHWNGKKWSLQEVDPGSGLIAYHCSIKYGPDDGPGMSWYLESVFVLRYAALEDGAWKAHSIDPAEAGKWNSLVLDSKDLPHLAYSSFESHDELRYAYFDGKEWVRSAIDTPEPGAGVRGMGASLVLGADGNPRISYYDLSALKYARYDGSKWVKEVIERLPPFAEWSWKNFSTVQLLDRNGNPHIGYESHLGLKHAWWDGKRWQTQLIRTPIGNSFFESSMTIDKDDNLYISFRDPADGSLKVAIGKPVPVGQTAKSLNKDTSKN